MHFKKSLLYFTQTPFWGKRLSLCQRDYSFGKSTAWPLWSCNLRGEHGQTCITWNATLNTSAPLRLPLQKLPPKWANDIGAAGFRFLEQAFCQAVLRQGQMSWLETLDLHTKAQNFQLLWFTSGEAKKYLSWWLAASLDPLLVPGRRKTSLMPKITNLGGFA